MVFLGDSDITIPTDSREMNNLSDVFFNYTCIIRTAGYGMRHISLSNHVQVVLCSNAYQKWQRPKARLTKYKRSCFSKLNLRTILRS